ncbi:MAG: hypothetical protein PHU85_17655 [Phycisphaerae bacterium]|nr:hypothetical protein [Phycisphaerae bacterium]
MSTLRFLLFLAALASVALAAPTTRPAATPPPPVRRPPAQLRQYQTKYYTIFTDMSAEDVRTATLRATTMADEYSRRLTGFNGRLQGRMPLYLYTNAEDYYAAGGGRGTGGCFTGKKLMAIVGARASENAWQLIQHEGFHQFAEQLISSKIPCCIEEGLADYFGNGIFTGDGFVFGIILPGHRQTVQWLIREKTAKPLVELMKIQHPAYGADVNNYMQGWSLVFYLLHGDEDKNQQKLIAFFNAINRGAAPQAAWKVQFPNMDALEKQWSDWWMAVPKGATAESYGKAMAATATSFFARATAAKQTFESADEFLKLAAAEQLKCDPAQWLPPSLLAARVETLKWYGRWSIVAEPGQPPHLLCNLRAGGTIVGRFTLSAAGRVEKIDVRIDRPATQPD